MQGHRHGYRHNPITWTCMDIDIHMDVGMNMDIDYVLVHVGYGHVHVRISSYLFQWTTFKAYVFNGKPPTLKLPYLWTTFQPEMLIFCHKN